MLRWQIIWEKISKLLKKIELMRIDSKRNRWNPNRSEQVDQPASHANEPENLVEKEQLVEEVASAIDKLPERERMVMSLYYVEEMNLKKLGQYWTSANHVSANLSACVKTLRGKLKVENLLVT